MEMVFAFVALMTFADGTVEEWPAEFPTLEACEEFRAEVPNWLNMYAEQLGIVAASWDTECKEGTPQSRLPLDHQSDGHSH